MSEFITTGFSIAMIAMGFYVIYRLEKKELYNLFTVILIPSIIIFASWLLSSIFLAGFLYILFFLFPLLFVFSIMGGILAHEMRKQQQSTSI